MYRKNYDNCENCENKTRHLLKYYQVQLLLSAFLFLLNSTER